MQSIWLGLVVGALMVLGMFLVQAEGPPWFARGVVLEHRQVGDLVLENIPNIPKRIASRMAKYHQAETSFVFGWGAGGDGLILSKVIDEQLSVWHLAQPGAQATQVNGFQTPLLQVSLNPNPERNVFLHLRDDAGNERYQIYLFDQSSGRETMVSDGTSGHTGVRWSNRGDRFAFSSNRRNGRDWGVYVSSLENPATAAPVVQAPGAWMPVAWSPDDRLVLVKEEEYKTLQDLVIDKLQ